MKPEPGESLTLHGLLSYVTSQEVGGGVVSFG